MNIFSHLCFRYLFFFFVNLRFPNFIKLLLYFLKFLKILLPQLGIVSAFFRSIFWVISITCNFFYLWNIRRFSSRAVNLFKKLFNIFLEKFLRSQKFIVRFFNVSYFLVVYWLQTKYKTKKMNFFLPLVLHSFESLPRLIYIFFFFFIDCPNAFWKSYIFYALEFLH